MATNWLDILPHDVMDVVKTELAKNHKIEMLAELKSELLQDIPGDNVWVETPTMYHELVLKLNHFLTSYHDPIKIVKPWAETLELDIFERIGLNAILNTWQEHNLYPYFTTYPEKNSKINTYYIMSFLNMLSYQTLLSFKNRTEWYSR